MSDCDSDQPPDLVYSSDSDAEYDYPPEFSTYGIQWAKSLEQVIKIRALAPFVLGCFFGSETWKSLMVDSGLLMEQWLNGERISTPTLLKRIDLMEHFTECVTRVLRSEHKRQLAYSLLENLRSVLIIKRVLPAASGHQLIDKVREYLTMYPPDGDKDKVTLGILYACYQYVEVLKELERGDYVKEIVKLIHKEPECLEQTMENEMTKSDNNLNQRLINLYTEAIKESMFSYKLYVRRSKAYLKMADGGWLALMDAKCSMILYHKYLEAHYLYILASLHMKQKNRALEDFIQLQHLHFVSESEINQSLSKLANELGLTQAVQGHPFLPMEVTSSAESSSRLTEDHDDSEDLFPFNLRSRAQSEPRPLAVTSAARRQSVSRDRRKKNKKKHVKQDKPPNDVSAKESKRDKPLSSKASYFMPQNLSKDDYKKKAAQGSRFLLNQDYRNAVVFYKQAVDYDNGSPLKSACSDIDGLLVLYALGIALKKLGTKKDLGEAVKMFQDIIKAQPVRAMVHLALGDVYYLQTQFDKSEEILQQGLTLWQEQKPMIWPGTETLIDESKSSILKDGLDNLIISCHNPPPPVAKCCKPKEEGHLKVNIYIEDPEFKGYVRCLCFAKCIIEYHLDCWKKVNNELGRLAKKDLINVVCLTPDCNASIKSVTFYDMEGNEKRKVENDKPESRHTQQHVPRIKRQAKCERNMKLWEKRKLERKQKRLLAREELRKKQQSHENTQTEVKDDNTSAGGATGQTSNHTVENLLPPSGDIEQFATVLKKDTSAEDNTQMPRRKKKKEKLKKNMTLLEFVGNQDNEEEEEDDGGYFVLHPENWDMFEEQRPLSPTVNPFPPSFAWSPNPWQTVPQPNNAWSQPPTFTQNSASIVSSRQTTSVENDRQTEDQTANQNTKDFIYSYFYNILEHHGPRKLSDSVITDGLKEFPEEVLQMIERDGGIGPFLSNNSQFQVIDDIVFLIQDGAKGLAIVQEQKKLLKEKYCSKLTQALLPTFRKNKKRKKRQVDMDRCSSNYNYMDEECLSERSWPESEVSEISKSSVPSNISPPAAMEDFNMKQPTTTVPSSSTAGGQVASSASSLLFPDNLFSPFKNYTGWMNNCVSSVESLVPVAAETSSNIENHTLGNHSNHLSGSGSGSPMTSVKAPEVSSALTVNSLNDVDDGVMDFIDDEGDDVDDNRSICSWFSTSSKPLREQDHMDDGLEISNMNASILDNVTGVKANPTATDFTEPISISLSSPKVSKKSRGRMKKSTQKSAIDIDKIKSKLSKLSTPDDVPDQTRQQPVVNEDNLLQSSCNEYVSSPLHLPEVKTGQINISYSEASCGNSHLNMPPFTSQPSDNEICNSYGSVGLGSATTNSVRSILYRETGTNTDTVMADWTKMQAQIRCLQEENAKLKESLEREKQTQHEMSNEHHKQMEHIITNLNSQTEVIENLIKKLEQERRNHETETTELKSEISQLKTRLARIEDTAARNDVYGMEETEKYGIEDIQAACSKVQDNLSDMEAVRREAEKKLKGYAKIRKRFQDKNVPVPTQITTYYSKWKLYLQEHYKQQLDPVGSECKQPITKVKNKTSMTNSKLLQVPELPLLPDTKTSAISFDKQYTQSSQLLPGHQSSKTTSNFDMIVSELKQMFPDCLISDIKQHILDYRWSRGGTLSGLPLADIIHQVASNITKKDQQAAISRQHVLSPRTALAQPSMCNEEVFQENDPCVICLEELTPGTELKNECGHKFHSRCIREWLKRDSICPTCRQHILLQDEFPSLH